MHGHSPDARPPGEIILANLDARSQEFEAGISHGAGDGVQGIPVAIPGSGAVNYQQGTTASGIAVSHLTALLNPESGGGAQLVQLARASGFSASQVTAAGHGQVPKIGSANLLAAETSYAAGDVTGPDGNAQDPVRAPLTGGDQDELPLPHAAGLIADVIPFDRATLEHAVDRFFDELEDLGVGHLVERGSPGVIPLSLTAVGTMVAAEIIRRRFRVKAGEGHATRRRDPIGSDELLGFPELPGSWSTRLT